MRDGTSETGAGQGPVRLDLEERSGGALVATLTVANPERLNILDSVVLEAFEERLAELQGSERLGVVVLQGGGARAFIGGADIRELARLDAGTARAFIAAVHRVCAGLRALPVPVIARISGYCLGAGLEVAASCDLRVATESSQFGMPEVQLGLPSVVEAALLPQLIGWGRTKELVYAGRSFPASEVATWGLVERVVPPRELDAAVEEWVSAILRAGPRAIRLQKELIRQWEALPLEAAIEAGIESFARAYETDEPRERTRQFLDRRNRR
ncbi:MAG TPA: enoyl-CoA hydratase [Thermoanaerobaculia bacterium]|nr:enoyl-CoA hydratase [Thermoanaerobaculia bacterium]